jgi:hypothetical protein
MGVNLVPRKRSPYAVGPTAVTWSVGTESSNAISITGTVKGPGGQALGYVSLDVLISDTATGADVAASAPSGGVAIGSYGKILAAVVAGKLLKVRTDSSGRFQLTLTESTAKSFYVHATLPDGTTDAKIVTFA